ncbi:MAG: helix-turn-helix transcriptional regulator [Pseudomonadota bacterium]
MIKAKAIAWALSGVGPKGLNDREWEVIGYLKIGLTNKQIAKKMKTVGKSRPKSITEQAVKWHLTNIYRKLGITSGHFKSRRLLAILDANA